MTPSEIKYSKKMVSSISRYIFDHQADVQQFIKDTPEQYKKFCEEWDRTHAKAT